MPSKPRLTAPPRFIEPQQAKIAEKAPTGDGWAHEINYDGYRMAARNAEGKARLLTRIRAKEAREMARNILDPAAREAMIAIAENYGKIAKRAEAREAGVTSTT
jgi:bifunctional non-homologous end joining protein LigD